MEDRVGIISFRRNVLELMFEISFFLYCCASQFYSLPGVWLYVYYVFFVLFLGVGFITSLLKLSHRGTLHATAFNVWNFVFLLFVAISAIWAVFEGTTGDMLFRLFQNFIIAFFVIDYIDTDEKMRRICDCIIYSILFLVVIVLALTPASQWFSGNLGTALGNRNAVAETEAIGAIICLVLAMSGREKNYYALYSVFFVMTILATSRRSILLLISISAIIVFINSNFKTFFINMTLLVAAAFAVYWVLMNVPSLYEVGGKSMEQFILHYTRGADADSSLVQREYYISQGIELFKRKPILGYGSSSFVPLVTEKFGTNLYSHNNYVEMLVSYGIVGTALYYLIHLYILVKSIPGVLRKKPYAVLAVSMIVYIVVAHIGTVAFYSKQEHLFLAIAFIGLYCDYIKKSEMKRKTKFN